MIELKPKNCRLSDEQWKSYLAECKPGRIFFTAGNSLMSRINRWFQRKMLRRSVFELHVDHVGIIGSERGAYESLFKSGPTREFFVDRYTCGDRQLIIAEWIPPFSNDEVDRGLDVLISYLRSNVRKYDWFSLLTFGRLQKNNAMICSEFVQMYIDEALRMRPTHKFIRDRLILPDELLNQVNIKFSG
jgi:hypothetical protein